MAKYCVFCGSELPDVAQFCPICGKKQPAIQTESETKIKPTQSKKESFEDEEDSAELDLLSQFGFVSTPKKTPPFKPTTIKQQEVKTPSDKNTKKENPILTQPESTKNTKIVDVEIEEDIPQTQPIKKTEEKIEINNTTNKEKEVIPEKTQLKKEEKISTNANQKVRRQSVRQDRGTIPFQPTQKEEPTNAMPTTSSSDVKYDLPEDFNKEIENEFNADSLFETTPPEEEEAMRKAQAEQKDKEAEAIAAKRKKNDFKKKKKEISVDDEEESFNTTLKDNSNSVHMLEKETLYADEVQENIDRKKAVVDDDDDTPVRPERHRKVEGRKNIDKADKRKRRRSAREVDINKKIYNIEQDMSQIDPEEEEYDGYYENVLPLDAGQIQKTKIDPKYILIGLGLLALIAGAIFLIVKMLGF